MFTPHAREIADKKRENFALRMELEKVKDSVKDRYIEKLIFHHFTILIKFVYVLWTD